MARCGFTVSGWRWCVAVKKVGCALGDELASTGSISLPVWMGRDKEKVTDHQILISDHNLHTDKHEDSLPISG
jgi:hypothetical protein